jgi:hypothetical protein
MQEAAEDVKRKMRPEPTCGATLTLRSIPVSEFSVHVAVCLPPLPTQPAPFDSTA